MDKNNDFQKNLERLDEIVEKISHEKLSLDESLLLYNEGRKIIEELEKELQEAETKIKEAIEVK